MADSPTTRNRFRQQSLGSNLNVWGDPYLNTNFQLIDDSLDGQTTITLTSGTTTLTSNNYATDEARMRVLVLAGTLSGNCTIIIPNVQKWYLVINGTTQASYTISIKTSGGVAASIPSSIGSCSVTCDGTDSAVRRTLDYGSNELTNVGTATASTSAATFGQVVTATENRSMGGFRLTSVGTGTATADAVNLGQMSAAIAAAGIGTGGGAIRISVTDTTPNFLGAKLFMGTATVGLTTANPGGNEAMLIPQMVGATTAAVGTIGLVPPAGTADTGNFLRGDGSWAAAASVLETQVFS